MSASSAEPAPDPPSGGAPPSGPAPKARPIPLQARVFGWYGFHAILKGALALSFNVKMGLINAVAIAVRALYIM